MHWTDHVFAAPFYLMLHPHIALGVLILWMGLALLEARLRRRVRVNTFCLIACFFAALVLFAL